MNWLFNKDTKAQKPQEPGAQRDATGGLQGSTTTAALNESAKKPPQQQQQGEKSSIWRLGGKIFGTTPQRHPTPNKENNDALPKGGKAPSTAASARKPSLPLRSTSRQQTSVSPSPAVTSRARSHSFHSASPVPNRPEKKKEVPDKVPLPMGTKPQAGGSTHETAPHRQQAQQFNRLEKLSHSKKSTRSLSSNCEGGDDERRKEPMTVKDTAAVRPQSLNRTGPLGMAPASTSCTSAFAQRSKACSRTPSSSSHAPRHQQLPVHERSQGSCHRTASQSLHRSVPLPSSTNSAVVPPEKKQEKVVDQQKKGVPASSSAASTPKRRHSKSASKRNSNTAAEDGATPRSAGGCAVCGRRSSKAKEGSPASSVASSKKGQNTLKATQSTSKKRGRRSSSLQRQQNNAGQKEDENMEFEGPRPSVVELYRSPVPKYSQSGRRSSASRSKQQQDSEKEEMNVSHLIPTETVVSRQLDMSENPIHVTAQKDDVLRATAVHTHQEMEKGDQEKEGERASEEVFVSPQADHEDSEDEDDDELVSVSSVSSDDEDDEVPQEEMSGVGIEFAGTTPFTKGSSSSCEKQKEEGERGAHNITDHTTINSNSKNNMSLEKDEEKQGEGSADTAVEMKPERKEEGGENETMRDLQRVPRLSAKGRHSQDAASPLNRSAEKKATETSPPRPEDKSISPSAYQEVPSSQSHSPPASHGKEKQAVHSSPPLSSSKLPKEGSGAMALLFSATPVTPAQTTDMMSISPSVSHMAMDPLLAFNTSMPMPSESTTKDTCHNEEQKVVDPKRSAVSPQSAAPATASTKKRSKRQREQPKKEAKGEINLEGTVTPAAKHHPTADEEEEEGSGGIAARVRARERPYVDYTLCERILKWQCTPKNYKLLMKSRTPNLDDSVVRGIGGGDAVAAAAGTTPSNNKGKSNRKKSRERRSATKEKGGTSGKKQPPKKRSVSRSSQQKKEKKRASSSPKRK